jgi:hypothetical protein
LVRKASATLLLLSACYAHGDSHRLREDPLPGSVRPALLAPRSGRYRIERAGEPIGYERFTITSSASVWSVRGETVFDGPASHRQGYLLAISEITAEPVAFEAWIEVLGQRRTARGVETQGNFEISVRGIGGKEARLIPYASGTTLGFGSPLFHTLAMSLLLPQLVPGKPIEVRTIALSLPMLSPVVTLQTYTLRDRVGGVARVESKLAAARAPTGLWVQPDGLPIKVRAIGEDGVAVDMILEGATTATSASTSP